MLKKISRAREQADHFQPTTSVDEVHCNPISEYILKKIYADTREDDAVLYESILSKCLIITF